MSPIRPSGLVIGSLEVSLEVSEDGKNMKYYEVAPFFYELTPQLVHRAVPTLTDTREKPARTPEKESPTTQTPKEAAK
ncbi:hypothetical protein [Streptomyces venezuelae]